MNVAPFWFGDIGVGEKRKRHSGFVGIAEAGGTITWLIIKMAQGLLYFLLQTALVHKLIFRAICY